MKIPDPLLGAVTNAGSRFLNRVNSPLWKDSRALLSRNDYLSQQILKAKHIICLSDFQKKTLTKNGYPADKMIVQRHGIDTSDYLIEKNKKSGETINMLMVTSIVRHKGVHVAVEALMKSGNQNLKLVIYGNITGNDPYVSEMLETAKQDPRIIFNRTISQDLIGDVFNTADVFLMPVIWYENEPLVVKAAIYMGIPVMAARIGALPEMIHEGQNGWLLPPGDIPAWTEAFDNLSGQSLAALHVQSGQIKTMDESFNEILTLYNNIPE
jgi:glycosyltransferase involved in cell wall biosynthesis